MREISQEELDEILLLHYVWLKSNEEQEGKRANLSNFDLSGLQLWKANLHKAILRNVILSSTNLNYVCFVSADLGGADFRGALGLFNAAFDGANVTGAKFNLEEMEDVKLTEKQAESAYIIYDF